MFKQTLYAGVGMAAAVGVPYLLFNEPAVPPGPAHNATQQATQFVADQTAAAAEHADQLLRATQLNPQLPADYSLAPWAKDTHLPQRLEGEKVDDLTELFHFERTISWVTSRWARVSTAASEGNLQGYRVALVTGTRPDDLAGALTYYFNNQHQLQRITFRGTTGDVQRLVNTLSYMYGARQVTAAEPGVHLFQPDPKSNIGGTIRLIPAQVVTVTRPYERYKIELQLDRIAN